jgi:GH25 family lysozyme M1 (1,4-beta-N-acetylmuramidase)
MTLLLPDVSEWQTHVDLGGIKKMNGGAVILRAAYSLSHPDATFGPRRAEAAKLGYLYTGIYHYITAAADATAQAHKFVQLVGKLAPHEVPILDLEEGMGDQSGRAAAWFGVVDEAFGLSLMPLNKRSWLYSGEDFAQGHGLGPVFASARHTWVAAYRNTEPTLGHTLWQSTNGVVGANRTNWPGCGFVDTSLYHGSLPQLTEAIRRC